MTKWLILLCALACVVGCNRSESSAPMVVERGGAVEAAPMQPAPEMGPGARISGAPISAGDSAFMKEAAMDGLMEVQMGELAARQGRSEDVRAFGQKLVSDHRAVNKELMQLGTQKGISLPERLGLNERKDVDRFAAMSGADFDRAWLRQIIEDHKDDIEKFERQGQDAQDPQVKAFASKTLPALQDHLRRAEEIQRSAGQE